MSQYQLTFFSFFPNSLCIAGTMRVSCGRGCQMVPGTMARSRPFGRLASVCGRGITPGSLSPSPRSTGHRSSPPWSPSSLVLRLLLLLLLMFPPFYSPNYFKRDCLLHTLKLIFTSFCMCVCRLVQAEHPGSPCQGLLRHFCPDHHRGSRADPGCRC